MFQIMRKYELITILKNSGELEAIKKAVKDILERNKVEIVSEDDWGARTLNYEVKKIPQGFFFYMTLNLDPQAVKEISREMHITSGVLQHMFKQVA